MKVHYFVTRERIEAASRFEKLLITFPRVVFASVTPDVSDTQMYHVVLGKARGKPEVADDAFRALIEQHGKQYLTDQFHFDLTTVFGESNARDGATAGQESDDASAGSPTLPTLPPGCDS